jgi:hypothetical protein
MANTGKRFHFSDLILSCFSISKITIEMTIPF